MTTPLEYWSYFLKHGKEFEAETLPTVFANTPLEKAVEELKMFTQDEIARGLYETRLKASMDERSKLHDKYLTGFQEGEELGLKKGEELGLQKGEELGLKKGKLEAIELALEIKFGPEGLPCLDVIRNIADIAKLSQVQQFIKEAKTVRQLRQKLAKL